MTPTASESTDREVLTPEEVSLCQLSDLVADIENQKKNNLHKRSNLEFIPRLDSTHEEQLTSIPADLLLKMMLAWYKKGKEHKWGAGIQAAFGSENNGKKEFEEVFGMTYQKALTIEMVSQNKEKIATHLIMSMHIDPNHAKSRFLHEFIKDSYTEDIQAKRSRIEKQYVIQQHQEELNALAKNPTQLPLEAKMLLVWDHLIRQAAQNKGKTSFSKEPETPPTPEDILVQGLLSFQQQINTPDNHFALSKNFDLFVKDYLSNISSPQSADDFLKQCLDQHEVGDFLKTSATSEPLTETLNALAEQCASKLKPYHSREPIDSKAMTTVLKHYADDKLHQTIDNLTYHHYVEAFLASELLRFEKLEEDVMTEIISIEALLKIDGYANKISLEETKGKLLTQLSDIRQNRNTLAAADFLTGSMPISLQEAIKKDILSKDPSDQQTLLLSKLENANIDNENDCYASLCQASETFKTSQSAAKQLLDQAKKGGIKVVDDDAFKKYSTEKKLYNLYLAVQLKFSMDYHFHLEPNGLKQKHMEEFCQEAASKYANGMEKEALAILSDGIFHAIEGAPRGDANPLIGRTPEKRLADRYDQLKAVAEILRIPNHQFAIPDDKVVTLKADLHVRKGKRLNIDMDASLALAQERDLYYQLANYQLEHGHGASIVQKAKSGDLFTEFENVLADVQKQKPSMPKPNESYAQILKRLTDEQEAKQALQQKKSELVSLLVDMIYRSQVKTNPWADRTMSSQPATVDLPKIKACLQELKEAYPEDKELQAIVISPDTSMAGLTSQQFCQQFLHKPGGFKLLDVYDKKEHLYALVRQYEQKLNALEKEEEKLSSEISNLENSFSELLLKNKWGTYAYQKFCLRGDDGMSKMNLANQLMLHERTAAELAARKKAMQQAIKATTEQLDKFTIIESDSDQKLNQLYDQFDVSVTKAHIKYQKDQSLLKTAVTGIASKIDISRKSEATNMVDQATTTRGWAHTLTRSIRQIFYGLTSPKKISDEKLGVSGVAANKKINHMLVLTYAIAEITYQGKLSAKDQQVINILKRLNHDIVSAQDTANLADSRYRKLAKMQKVFSLFLLKPELFSEKSPSLTVEKVEAEIAAISTTTQLPSRSTSMQKTMDRYGKILNTHLDVKPVPLAQIIDDRPGQQQRQTARRASAAPPA